MARNPSKISGTTVNPQPGTEDYQRMVAEAAYFRALQRGFLGGDAFDDWVEAEREIGRRYSDGPPQE